MGRAFQGLRRGLKACYEGQVCGAKGLEGKVVFRVSLFPSGQVRQVDAQTDHPRLRELVPCMSRKISEVRFPPPAEGSELLVIPVLFAHRDDACGANPSSCERCGSTVE